MISLDRWIMGDDAKCRHRRHPEDCAECLHPRCDCGGHGVDDATTCVECDESVPACVSYEVLGYFVCGGQCEETFRARCKREDEEAAREERHCRAEDAEKGRREEAAIARGGR